MIAGALWLVLAGAVDPCGALEPGVAPDPAAAAEYRAVAREEAAAGGRETALLAWRRAASLDPADREAPAALAALCAAGAPVASKGAAPADPLPAAIALLDAGRYREAAEALRAARRGSPSSDAALLEGICRFELGELSEASLLLRVAEADPAHAATARLYLGLVALAEGSPLDAASLLDDAAANPALAPFATELSRAARWEGPFFFSLLAEGGWDSNVRLAPQASTRRGTPSNGDGVATLSALAVGRPFGANGLYLRVAGAIQQYARFDAYDFTSWEGAAGGRWWRGASGITGEYAWADRTLGGQAYLRTHRFLASGAVGAGRFQLAATWWGRLEDYAAAWSSWSGFAQRADARLAVAPGPRLRVAAGWAFGLDDADVKALGWTEQGPRADLRILLGSSVRLLAEGGYTERRYASFDPTYGLRLEERLVDVAGAVEWDLGRRTTLRATVSGRWSDSNYDPLDYGKVVPTVAFGVMMTP